MQQGRTRKGLGREQCAGVVVVEEADQLLNGCQLIAKRLTRLLLKVYSERELLAMPDGLIQPLLVALIKGAIRLIERAAIHLVRVEEPVHDGPAIGPLVVERR